MLAGSVLLFDMRVNVHWRDASDAYAQGFGTLGGTCSQYWSRAM
jgi:hypothetical protein